MDIPSKGSSLSKAAERSRFRGKKAHGPLALEKKSDTSCDVSIKHLKLGLSLIILDPLVTAA